MKPGLLIVVSGPAGVGKGTIVSQVRQRSKDVVFSVSATSRNPRPGEIDGENYFFVSREQFEKMIEKSELLEWVEYCGNYYGTPKAYVEAEMAKGHIVILEIDVEGAGNIKKQYPESVSIFISPPSLEELRNRITKRGTELAEIIEARMERAKKELDHIREYDYIIINDTVEKSTEEFLQILDKERNKIKKQSEE